MPKVRKFRIYFSDFFEVEPSKIEEYGAFNISLLNDLPLFVDPFLLFNSENPRYKQLHDEIIRYMLFLKKYSATPIADGLVKSWYYFPEVRQNWFGFSKTGNNGRGLGRDFANSLKRNLTTVFSQFGEEVNTHTHLGKLTLIKNGVGKDQISDFTCNLIRGYLAEYTEQFALSNVAPGKLKKFNVPKISFNYETGSWSTKQYTLPRFGNDFVLLTPVDMLTKDEAWISHQGFREDFSAIVASIGNDSLRAQIEHYFASALPVEATRAERDKAIEAAVAKYPELMDLYIRRQEDTGTDARETSAQKIQSAQSMFVDNLRQLVATLDSTKFYSTPHSSYSEGMRRVSFLKFVIEKQDGYRLFYLKGKPISREVDLQIMFKLTWFASEFSADAEVNNGRGPADFLVSYGSADKSIIEFKLASNSQLERNLAHQAEIYKDAARAKNPPIKVILFFKPEEKMKVQRILRRLGLGDSKDVVLIDASPKDSASKASD